MKNNAENLVPFKKQVEQTKTDLKKLKANTRTKFVAQGRDIKWLICVLGFLFLFLIGILGAVIRVPFYITGALEKTTSKLETTLHKTTDDLEASIKTNLDKTKNDLNISIASLKQSLGEKINKNMSDIEKINKHGKIHPDYEKAPWKRVPEKNETTK